MELNDKYRCTSVFRHNLQFINAKVSGTKAIILGIGLVLIFRSHIGIGPPQSQPLSRAAGWSDPIRGTRRLAL